MKRAIIVVFVSVVAGCKGVVRLVVVVVIVFGLYFPASALVITRASVIVVDFACRELFVPIPIFVMCWVLLVGM